MPTTDRFSWAFRAVLLTAAMTFAGCDDVHTQTSDKKTSPIQKPVQFTVGIRQDGQPLPVDKKTHLVHLNKKPFQIVFYFEKMSSMLVQASFQPTFVRQAEGGARMDQILRQDGTIVEDQLNPDFTLYLSDGGLHHNWFYVDPQNHRFDANGVQPIPEKQGGGYYCVRTVRQLNVEEKTLPVAQCPSDKIYLLFFQVDRLSGIRSRAERQRDWLVLAFEN